ncbi:MAG: hemolysin III family protein [Spirochaetota bacterium]
MEERGIIAIPGFSEPVSSFTHLFVTPLFLVLAILLLIRRKGQMGTLFYHLLYIFSVFFMFSISGVYHLLQPGGTPRAVLQRLDHAGIFLLIAATFTPVHGILFTGFKKWGIISIIWVYAATAIALKSIFFASIPEWLSLTLYLTMGWIGGYSGYLVKKEYGNKLLSPLVLGAVYYTIGAVIDFLKFPVLIKGVLEAHEIFHIFVILGVFYHWKFIYSFANKENFLH